MSGWCTWRPARAAGRGPVSLQPHQGRPRTRRTDQAPEEVGPAAAHRGPPTLIPPSQDPEQECVLEETPPPHTASPSGCGLSSHPPSPRAPSSLPGGLSGWRYMPGPRPRPGLTSRLSSRFHMKTRPSLATTLRLPLLRSMRTPDWLKGSWILRGEGLAEAHGARGPGQQRPGQAGRPLRSRPDKVTKTQACGARASAAQGGGRVQGSAGA